MRAVGLVGGFGDGADGEVVPEYRPWLMYFGDGGEDDEGFVVVCSV